MGRLRRKLKKTLIETSETGLSLELRLIGQFIIFLVTIMLCISLILVATGVFKAGMGVRTFSWTL